MGIYEELGIPKFFSWSYFFAVMVPVFIIILAIENPTQTQSVIGYIFSFIGNVFLFLFGLLGNIVNIGKLFN